MINRKRKRKVTFIDFLEANSDKIRLLIEILFITLTALSFPYLTKFLFKDESQTFTKSTVLIISIVTVTVIFVATRLFKFLNNDVTERKSDSTLTYLQRQEILESQRNIETIIKESLHKNPEILKVEELLYNKVVSNLESSLITKLDERFQNNIRAEFIINSIITELTPLTKNIEKYIDRIQRNSIVNLFIGIIGTIAAITILAFAILTNKQFGNLQDFFIHFLPRFTFVVFIQLFAFFFLKLYKNNLEDAKYFQNELTNLTAKSSSIKISYLLGNEDKVAEIIKELATTERNFKLTKDETTIGLEKAKLDSEFDKSLIDQFKDILNKYESKR